MKSNRKAVKAEKKRERRRQKRERSARIRIAKQERKRAQKAARKQYTYNKRMAVYGEDNLFNRISGRTHRVAVQAVSNIRLSLSLRISWNYTRLLLSMCATELLLCLILAVGLEMYVLPRDAAENVYHGAQSAVPAVTVVASPDRPAHQLYVGNLFGGFSGLSWEGRHHLKLTYRVSDLYVTYDVAWHVAALGMLVAVLLALDVLRALRFMSAGRRINAQVLEPIDEITALAQKLSVNDLGRRINVEGTKNELKDLAVVINEMLDRIELAYNGQKQFVSDASHELRTPIAVIQGYANLLDRWGKDNPQVRDEAISAIISETQSMKELVEKLLFLARHDKKTLKLKPERFDVRDMIDESIKETEIITAAHTVRTGKLDHAIVNADRGALKQAVRILVDNAVKYTPDGGVITIECAASAESVALSVTDSGVGISGSELSAIFDRFYRADAARSGETPGHGLGLSILKIIVLSLGGKVRVRSTVGKGSTFTILLPRVG